MNLKIFKGTPKYLLDSKLSEAFHIARLLEKPLLLEGEPGTGKTKLAVKLANKYNGEIISADSRQVYRGMNIGTGKDINEYEINISRVR